MKKRGQKPGKKSLVGKESAKNREEGLQAKIKKISKALFARKAIVNNHVQVNG